MVLRATIFCPAYNAQGTLAELLERTARQKAALARQGIRLEKFIIVNDGSSDGTASALSSLRRKHGFLQVIGKRKNEGAAAAVLDGMRAALAGARKSGIKNAVLVRMDSDLEHQPEDLPALLQPLASGKAGACVGYIPFDSRNGIAWQWFNRIIGMAESREFLGLEIPQFCPGFYAMKAGEAARMLPALEKMSEGYRAVHDEEMLFLDLAALAIAKKHGLGLATLRLRPIEGSRIKKPALAKFARYLAYHKKAVDFLRKSP